MLPASKTVGGPSTMTPPAPTVYSPSLPALNFSPSAPVIWPEASAAPAYAARYPRSAGFHSAKFLTVPSLTYWRIWLGVPSPVRATLPLYCEPDRYRAAAATPTVVGEMIPLRSGYDESRPWVSWNDFWSSSLPYAMVASWILLYSGFCNSFFIRSIQVFWLVALGVADRIAIFPAAPI